jgi:hypothetical protein
VVALEISLSVLDMIIGTQQGFHADFWKGVRENMRDMCNVLKKDALS